MVNRKKRRKRPGHAPIRQSPTRPSEDPCEGQGEKAEVTDVSVDSQVGVVDTEVVGGASLQVGVALRESSGNLSSSPSVTSISSDLELGTTRFVALDTALLGNQSSSEAEAEAAVSATAMVLSATLSSSSPHMKPRLQTSPPAGQPGTHTLSPDELREALLVMVKTKDELEEANR